MIKTKKPSLSKLKKKKTKKERNMEKISWWDKKLDDIFTVYIKTRDTVLQNDGSRIGKCITCQKIIVYSWIDENGKTHTSKDAQAGHFCTRGKKETRFNEKNVHLQCSGCNKWGGGKFLEYEVEMIKLYGKENVEYLKYIALNPDMNNQFWKDIDWYQEKIKEYQSKLDKLSGGGDTVKISDLKFI